MLIVPQVGARYLLSRIFQGVVTDYEIQLFKNDIVPSQATVLGDLVVADFDGYVPLIDLGPWSAPATIEGHAKTLSPQVQYLHGGGAGSNQIFGYWVENDGNLAWLERFPGGPVLMQAGSPPLLIVAVLTFISEQLF